MQCVIFYCLKFIGQAGKNEERESNGKNPKQMVHMVIEWPWSGKDLGDTIEYY